MSTPNWRDLIACDPKIRGGKPVVKGTRLSVDFILVLLASDWPPEAIFEELSFVNEEKLQAVIAYASRE